MRLRFVAALAFAVAYLAADVVLRVRSADALDLTTEGDTLDAALSGLAGAQWLAVVVLAVAFVALGLRVLRSVGREAS